MLATWYNAMGVALALSSGLGGFTVSYIVVQAAPLTVFMADVTTFRPEVTYAWLKDGDEPFKKTAGDFLSGVIGNPSFPKAQERATKSKELYDIYAPTVVDRDKQTSDTSAARIAARTPLELELRLLLADVQAESGGDLVKLNSTNAPLARNAETTPTATKPEKISFYLWGNPEQLFVQCEPQPGDPVYVARVSEDDVNWKWIKSDKRSSVGFFNLPAGVKLYAQMMVQNSVSESPWSDSKPFMIPAQGISIPERKRPKGRKK